MIINKRKVFQVVFSLCFMIGTTLAHFTELPIKIPGLKIPSNPSVRVLDIETFEDWAWASFYVGMFYVFKFLLVGGVLEITNPIPKTQYRTKMMKKQIYMGLWALFFVITTTTLFFWKVEKYMPYYGYYETNAFGIKEFLLNIIVYMFCFDTWFWFTHVLFHHPFLWKHVHVFHHQFVEPTAFGQDAVHPLEAIVQGPFGHFMCTLFYPMHPVAHSVFGLLTSFYAIFAHDGRWDPNFHIAHHHYNDVNFGLYWGFWDKIFGTRYNPTKHGVYKPTWERNDQGLSLLKNIEDKERSK
ncbi:hypothetical protein ABPG74_005369 [Tetrahymena malaccensis]